MSEPYPFRYLPTSAVRYFGDSHVAIVEWSSNDAKPPCGGKFLQTPVELEYRPVRMVDRDGQHIELLTNMFLNVTP
jgi:hypothetical protein